jgi:penicillin-binding protein 2
VGYTALPSADAYAEKYRARGYAPDERVGATGVEQLYEAELHGEAGARLYHVDAAGRPLQEREEQSPQPGHNLVLSIDSDLQHAATDLLAARLQTGPATGPPTGTTGPGSGAVVIMDPRNGEVLSLVSLPTFDANVFTIPDRGQEIGDLLADPGLPLFNRAVSGQYPPGSTFKLVTGIGALEERIANRNTRINCNGGLRIPNPYNPQLSTFLPDWGVLGTLDFIQGVAQSCNVYFYTLGGGFGNIQGLGSARLGQYAQLLGYGTATGIDLPSETRGRVPNPEWKRAQFSEDWLPGDTYNMAIGQGFVLATPLQVAMVTNLIAMKGTAYRPHLVRAVTDADGREVRATTPEVVRQVTLRPDTLQTLRDGMIAVLDTPQARGNKLPGVTVAGKTGTAEYAGERDAKGNLPTHGWFTAYAPADNPRVSVTVFLEYGGGPGDAYPLAMQIMREYFARYP